MEGSLRLPLRGFPATQKVKKAQGFVVVGIEQQPFLEAKGFQFGHIRLLGHVIKWFGPLAVNDAAMPVHQKRLAALAIVPGLAVKCLPVQQLLFKQANHHVIRVLALQHPQRFAGEFPAAVTGHF
jgi:hypothetical protein